MKHSTSQRLLVFINLLIYIAGLFAFTYAGMTFARAIERPYGLSPGYQKLIHNDPNVKISFSDISPSVWEETPVEYLTVIAVKEDILGLYDPQLTFSLDPHYIMPGTLRIFSYRDYKEQKKVGYYLLDSPSEVPNLTSAQAIAPPELEIINGIGEDSGLYDGNKNYIINLTSMETMGPEIYIDGNPGEVDRWSRTLQGHGYQMETKEKADLGEALIQFLGGFNRISIFLYLTLILYILLLFGILTGEISAGRHAKIHSIYGGQGIPLFFSLHRDLTASLLGNVLIFIGFFFIATKHLIFESINPAGFAVFTIWHMALFTGASVIFHRLGFNIAIRRGRT